ncbi:hypothetical protein BDAP_000975 [Binucleata daphniae]
MQVKVKTQQKFPYSALFPPFFCKFFILSYKNKAILVEPFANCNYNFYIGQNLANMLANNKKVFNCNMSKYNKQIYDASLVYMKINNILDINEMIQIRYVNINSSTENWSIIKIEEAKEVENDYKYYKKLLKNDKKSVEKVNKTVIKDVRDVQDTNVYMIKDVRDVQDTKKNVIKDVRDVQDTKKNDTSAHEVIDNYNSLARTKKVTPKKTYYNMITSTNFDLQENHKIPDFYKLTPKTCFLYTNNDKANVFGYENTENKLKAKINVNMNCKDSQLTNMFECKFLLLVGDKSLKKKEICQKVSFDLKINHLHIDCKSNIELFKSALNCNHKILFTI